MGDADVPPANFEVRNWVIESPDVTVPVPHFGRLAVCERLRVRAVRWAIPASGPRLLNLAIGPFLGNFSLGLPDGTWLDLTTSIMLGEPGTTLMYHHGRSAWEWDGRRPIAIEPQLRIRALVDEALNSPDISPANPLILSLEFEVR